VPLQGFIFSNLTFLIKILKLKIDFVRGEGEFFQVEICPPDWLRPCQQQNKSIVFYKIGIICGAGCFTRRPSSVNCAISSHVFLYNSIIYLVYVLC